MDMPTLTLDGNKASWYSIFPWSGTGASGHMDPLCLRMATVNNMNFPWAWADLVPTAMQTGNPTLFIHSASIQIAGVLLPNQDYSALVIEAPEYSLKWKKLASAESGQNVYNRQAHDPPITLNHDDYLCAQCAWSDAYKFCEPQRSWMSINPSHDRIWIVTLEYTIGAP